MPHMMVYVIKYKITQMVRDISRNSVQYMYTVKLTSNLYTNDRCHGLCFPTVIITSTSTHTLIRRFKKAMNVINGFTNDYPFAT